MGGTFAEGNKTSIAAIDAWVSEADRLNVGILGSDAFKHISCGVCRGFRNKVRKAQEAERNQTGAAEVARAVAEDQRVRDAYANGFRDGSNRAAQRIGARIAAMASPHFPPDENRG